MKKQKMTRLEQIENLKDKLTDLQGANYSGLQILWSEVFSKKEIEEILFYGLTDDIAETIINNTIDNLTDVIIREQILNELVCDLYGVCASTSCKNYYKCKM